MSNNQLNLFPKTQHKIWLYKFLGWFTILYVILQLSAFHLQLASMPHGIVFFWAATLLCYVILNIASKYAGLNSTKSQKGEAYAILVIGTFLWMNFFNLVRKWGYNKEYLEMPEFITESAIEALILLVASVVFSWRCHLKNCNNNQQSSA